VGVIQGGGFVFTLVREMTSPFSGGVSERIQETYDFPNSAMQMGLNHAR